MNIQNIVVLMLENRSFDHLFGGLKAVNNKIEGLNGNESIPLDPRDPQSQMVKVTPSTQFGVPFGIAFDPAHEFPDVQVQLYGPPPMPNPLPAEAPMNGFAFSGNEAVQAQEGEFPNDYTQVMEYFPPDQIPVLSTLVQNFAVFNWWFSSLPGPTWPNRYFIHAATSGGLNYSPSDLKSGAAALLGFGYKFKKGTIYDLLQSAGKEWRIYYGDLPQAASISSLYQDFHNPVKTHFRDFANFDADVAAGTLPEYTFIEPDYDVAGNYQSGKSMHPLNDIQSGESLVKQVYETLRKSDYWEKLLLIITFDEHGGFYDHVPPAQTIPTGDDSTYADPVHYSFTWDRLGVRVPNIVISAYTPPGTVIDKDKDGQPYILDHTSVLATVEKIFGLPNLTNRDLKANTLEPAFPLQAAIQTAPMQLPDPKPVIPLQLSAEDRAAFDNSPISSNQESFLELAHACDLEMAGPQEIFALKKKYRNVKRTSRQKDAAEYIRRVQKKIRLRRKPDNYLLPPGVETRKYKYRPPSASHPLLSGTRKAGIMTALPSKVDLRYLCLPVRDQGPEGCCSGFSTAACCETRQAAMNKSLLPDYLSPAYIYARTRMQDGTFPQDSGASLADEFSALANFGICPEPFMPYTGNPAELVLPKSDAAALPFRIQPVQVDRQPKALKSVLAGKKTISIGFMVYESFECPDSKGIVKMPQVLSEKFLGGHSVLLCGYDDTNSFWIVRNQWGNKWGTGGYCYMPYGYETHWTEAWTFG